MHSTQEKIRPLVIENKRTIKSFTRNDKANCKFKNVFYWYESRSKGYRTKAGYTCKLMR